MVEEIYNSLVKLILPLAEYYCNDERKMVDSLCIIDIHNWMYFTVAAAIPDTELGKVGHQVSCDKGAVILLTSTSIQFWFVSFVANICTHYGMAWHWNKRENSVV